MPIPYYFGGPARSNRRRQVEVAERAILLRSLLSNSPERTGLRFFLQQRAELAAVVLGLAPATSLEAPAPMVPQLEDLCLSLAYSMGADLRLVSDSGRVVLYNEQQVRRHLYALNMRLAHTGLLGRALLPGGESHGVVPDVLPAGVTGEAARLLFLALYTSTRLRQRIHPEPPAVVFSTAGVPDLTERTLGAYLDSFRRYEHQDVTVYLFDDAREFAPAMDKVVQRLRAIYGIDICHMREWEPCGAPGPKQRLRHKFMAALKKQYGPVVGPWVDRVFGPGLAGSANSAFWYLRGRTLVSIDQDSLPVSVGLREFNTGPHRHTEGFSSRVELMETIYTWEDLAETGHPRCRTDLVDVLYLTDWLLDAEPGEVTLQVAGQELPTREDPSYERVHLKATGPMAPVRICTFHICGQADYRGRLLHYHLLSRPENEEVAQRLLRGGMPYYRVFQAPPPTVVVGRSKTAYGTAIAFSAHQPVQPIPMLATQVRLVDFSVGELLQGSGPLSVAWAPAGLAHFRGTITNSGRGKLAPYVWNEDLLWPLLWEVRHALQGEAWRPPGLDRLQAAGRRLRTAAASYRGHPSLTARYFYGALSSRTWLAGMVQEPWLSAYGEELARMYKLPQTPNDDRDVGWWRFHVAYEQTIRQELIRYAEQLELWSIVSTVTTGEINPTEEG